MCLIVGRPVYAAQKDVRVLANRSWQATGISLKSGDEVTITATGEVQYTERKSAPQKGRCGPAGVPAHSESGDFREYSLGDPKWNHCAVVARVGKQIELVGASAHFTVREGGALKLSINDTDIGNNDGAFDVRISFSSSPGWHPLAALALGCGVAFLVGLGLLTGAPLLMGIASAAGAEGVGVITFLNGGAVLAILRTAATSGLLFAATAAGTVAVGAKISTSTDRLRTSEIVREAALTSGSVASGVGILNAGLRSRALKVGVEEVVFQNQITHGVVTGIAASVPKAGIETMFADKPLWRAAVDVGLGAVFGAGVGGFVPLLKGTSAGAADGAAIDGLVGNSAGLAGGVVGNVVDAVRSLFE